MTTDSVGFSYGMKFSSLADSILVDYYNWLVFLGVLFLVRCTKPRIMYLKINQFMAHNKINNDLDYSKSECLCFIHIPHTQENKLSNCKKVKIKSSKVLNL